MTANLRSNIWAQLGWTWRDHVDAAPIADSNRLQFHKDLADGSAGGQADAVWHAEDQVLADGVSTTLDLAALELDLFGSSLTISLAGVRAILIVTSATSEGCLIVGGAAADPWDAPFGSGADRVKIMPGGLLLLAHPEQGWDVQPGQTALKIEADGGFATYDIAILGNTSEASSSSGG